MIRVIYRDGELKEAASPRTPTKAEGNESAVIGTNIASQPGHGKGESAMWRFG